MKYFSKKTDATLLILSVIFLCLTSILILFSNNLLFLLQNFLETKIFHREFSLEKWADTINALIAFPIFFVIFVDTLIFVKLSNKSKVILISSYAFIVFVFIGICSALTSDHFIDSDMASELLLAKECFNHKTFLPRTWYYSTELRVLNTQLFTAPLFIFTSNLHIIKTISVLIICLLLPLSLYFLLTSLRIKTVWLKLLGCLLVFLPFSNIMWMYVQFGSYYIPHFAIAFCYVALFISISYNASELSNNKNKIYTLLFYLLALISGISGIRYILYFEFPLALTIYSYAISDFFKNKKEFNFKEFFIDDKPLFYVSIALLLGCFGYVLNSLVISRLFSFSQFYTTAFTTIGDVTFSEVYDTCMSILGYRNKVSVFTPAGIINVLLYVGLGYFIFNLFKFLKLKISKSHRIFITFVLIMTIFNGFTYIFTEYVGRYFTFLLIFLIPTIILFVDNIELHPVSRFILIASFSVLFLSSTFITFESALSSNGNKDKKDVSEFLNKNDYHYGYATFWNANVFTYLTNDKIKLANLYRDTTTEDEIITSKFKCDTWLTPAEYYTDDFGSNEKVILIVTKKEFECVSDAPVFSNGKKVYSDDYYYIFEYSNNKSFKNAFN